MPRLSCQGDVRGAGQRMRRKFRGQGWWLLTAVFFTATAAISSEAADFVGRVSLPVEIVGDDGTTISRTVLIADQQAGSVQALWLQVHGVRYAGQASVQINSSPWMPLNNDTVTIAEPARSFGGIGGFATLAMTVSLPSGTVTDGLNTIRFRFNRTDGVASGYRVLALNLLTAEGMRVLPAEDFAEEAPDSW